MGWLYVDAVGAECGPCSAEVLAAMVLSGELGETSLVRHADAALKYKQFVSYKELRETLQTLRSEATQPDPKEGDAMGSLEESEPPQVDEWYYRDDGDNARGPLSLQQMRELVGSGMLFPPRDVRKGSEGPYIDLGSWAELWPPDGQGDGLGLADPEGGDGCADYWQGPSWEAEGENGDDAEWDAPEAEWVYLDDSDAVQGPFVTSELRGWLEEGLLDYSRLVNLAGGESSGFRPAAEWAELHAAPREASSSPAAVEEHQEASAAEATAQTQSADAELADAVPSVAPEASSSTAPPGDGEPSSLALPATASVHAPSEWVYVDDNGAEQGPFTTAKLLSWLKRGLLTAERQVRPANSGAEGLRPMGSCGEFAEFARSELAADAQAVVAKPQTAAVAEEELEALWEYADDRGRVQGPFSARKLLGWVEKGALKPDRKVRRHGATDFVPLGSVAPFSVSITSALPAPPPLQPSLGGQGGGVVETPLWIYEDAQGVEQGPFTATMMMQWHQHHFLPSTTRVRHVRDPVGAYKLLGAVPLLGGRVAPPDPVANPTDSQTQVIVDAVEHSLSAPKRGYEDYVAKGTWVNGRFVPAERAGDAHFTSKGLAPDRAGRMMAHYFDHDNWQEEMNARKAAAKGKKKAKLG
ncbi:hypothetical protein AB1Y20_015376 [Prymnesium parvum]|uniref:GYF domain-containing protein n=1 Tax=Prymnesium parvum TaxID=97485 RepID=A0AB34K0K3_PRYPA